MLFFIKPCVWMSRMDRDETSQLLLLGDTDGSQI